MKYNRKANPKKRFFRIVLPIGIAYWPLLFPCGRTAAVIPLWITARLGGGQGVLGRTGLAWGAKGPGPGRLGSSLF